MPQAVTQAVIEGTKAAILAIREADHLVNNDRQVHTVPRSGGQVLKQQHLTEKWQTNIRNCANLKWRENHNY